MPLSSALWSEIDDDIWPAIRAHPFVTGLTDGSLDREAFRFYVVQDAHYLREYARALAICGARAPEVDAIRMFCEHAAGAIVVERELHESFFADFGMSEADVAATPMAPTNVAYTSYLVSAAYGGSYAEAVAAVLPCYWIYAEVGKELMAAGSPDPLYARWIETYGGEEFAAVVSAVLDTVDALGPTLSDADRAAAARRFVTTSRYEWMFWEMGRTQEAWPV
ncbi:MAG: thiaminase II [Solirubrobacteraceae bacterium]|nr:thiaminase II [Solirubrobacteraceae bacterium]